MLYLFFYSLFFLLFLYQTKNHNLRALLLVCSRFIPLYIQHNLIVRIRVTLLYSHFILLLYGRGHSMFALSVIEGDIIILPLVVGINLHDNFSLINLKFCHDGAAYLTLLIFEIFRICRFLFLLYFSFSFSFV